MHVQCICRGWLQSNIHSNRIRLISALMNSPVCWAAPFSPSQQDLNFSAVICSGVCCDDQTPPSKRITLRPETPQTAQGLTTPPDYSAPNFTDIETNVSLHTRRLLNFSCFVFSHQWKSLPCAEHNDEASVTHYGMLAVEYRFRACLIFSLLVQKQSNENRFSTAGSELRAARCFQRGPNTWEKKLLKWKKDKTLQKYNRRQNKWTSMTAFRARCVILILLILTCSDEFTSPLWLIDQNVMYQSNT